MPRATRSSVGRCSSRTRCPEGEPQSGRSSRIVLRPVVEAPVPSTRPTFVIDGGGGQVFRTFTISFLSTAGTKTHF